MRPASSLLYFDIQDRCWIKERFNRQRSENDLAGPRSPYDHAVHAVSKSVLSGSIAHCLVRLVYIACPLCIALGRLAVRSKAPYGWWGVGQNARHQLAKHVVWGLPTATKTDSGSSPEHSMFSAAADLTYRPLQTRCNESHLRGSGIRAKCTSAGWRTSRPVFGGLGLAAAVLGTPDPCEERHKQNTLAKLRPWCVPLARRPQSAWLPLAHTSDAASRPQTGQNSPHVLRVPPEVGVHENDVRPEADDEEDGEEVGELHRPEG